MRGGSFGWLWVVPVLALLGSPASAVRSGEGAAEIENKLRQVRKQLEELRRQEQALVAAREEARRKAAEKKAQYARVEVRGRLRRERRGGPDRQTVWVVSFGELEWPVDLGGKKELAAAAERLTGKAVILTGRVVGRTWPPGGPGGGGPPQAVVEAESLKPAEK